MKRLAAVLPKDAADAVCVYEPRHVYHNCMAFRGQGALVTLPPRQPKGRARGLQFIFLKFAQQTIRSLARDPPGATAHYGERCEHAAMAFLEVDTIRVALLKFSYCLPDGRQDGIKIRQQLAAVWPDQLVAHERRQARKQELNMTMERIILKGNLTAPFQ